MLLIWVHVYWKVKSLKTVSRKDNQGLFLSLFMFSIIILMLFVSFVIWFISPRLNQLNYSGSLNADILKIVFSLLTVFITSLFLAIYWKKKVPVIHYFLDVVIRISYPRIMKIGNLLNIQEKKIKSSFLQVNNNIIENENNKYNSKNLLLLISQEYQHKDCNIRITNNIENCHNCINCNIGKIYGYAKDNNLNLEIMRGITSTLNTIASYKLIIAIASNEELIEILKKTDSVRIYGILNENYNCESKEFDVISQVDSVIGKLH